MEPATTLSRAPVWEGDFWDDGVILDPYPHYDRLRDLGPAVWLERHDAWAITRYDAVRAALLAPEVFSSADGCMMNEPMNASTQGIMLCSDDPEHLAMRRLFARPLQPKALESLRARLQALVDERLDELAARQQFDAVAELAHLLPLEVVTQLVGLDDEGRANMLTWAAGIFDAFGPLPNTRTEAGLAIAQEVISYVLERVERRNLIPDGWGSALFVAVDAGTISETTARLLLVDYLTPSLDTTINAASAAIELFAAHPDQWQLLRGDLSLLPQAINEVVRLESPIRAFARSVRQATRIGDAELRRGDRALMLYACANRDPRKFVDPERFDITRRNGDHLGFGMGTHLCAGMHLAKLEISVLLGAMAKRFAAIRTGTAKRNPHNTLRGLASLETSLVAG
jgi:cytochrome P450